MDNTHTQWFDSLHLNTEDFVPSVRERDTHEFNGCSVTAWTKRKSEQAGGKRDFFLKKCRI